jgi:hypothetical protein
VKHKQQAQKKAKPFGLAFFKLELLILEETKPLPLNYKGTMFSACGPF